MNEIRKFIAKESDVDLRLDKFLVYAMPEFSRSEIQKFNITDVANPTRKIKFSDKIKLAEEYSVEIPERAVAMCRMPSDVADIELDILFEDDDIIVVNKPRGISMYPGAGRDSGTLVQNILAHTHLSAIGGDGCRPGVVHRIDKDTSGVVILAKSDAAHRALTLTFARHNLLRKYVTFVWGIPTWEGADIEGNIARSVRNRQKMNMVKVGGKPARTHVDVVRVWPHADISQMRCILDTGRTHQIRVHLSAHGFPVVCDPLYGRGNSRLGSVKDQDLLEFIKTHRGQMLHAEILELKHPITGEIMKFRAPLPDDMAELREILETEE